MTQVYTLDGGSFAILGGMNIESATKIIYNFLDCSQPPEKADAVIAFGSYHRPVAEVAARLVLDNYAPLMVCTGASTPLTKDIAGGSEADYFAEIARSLGVAESHIIKEPRATNTGENIALSLQLLRDRGIDPETVLACAIPPHLRRVVATFARQAPQLRVIPIQVPFQREDYRTRLGMSYGRRLVAELERLREYPEKGFTVPVVIPPEVEEAARWLFLEMPTTKQEPHALTKQAEQRSNLL